MDFKTCPIDLLWQVRQMRRNRLHELRKLNAPDCLINQEVRLVDSAEAALLARRTEFEAYIDECAAEVFGREPA